MLAAAWAAINTPARLLDPSWVANAVIEISIAPRAVPKAELHREQREDAARAQWSGPAVGAA